MVWYESVNRQVETARPAVAPQPPPDEEVEPEPLDEKPVE